MIYCRISTFVLLYSQFEIDKYLYYWYLDGNMLIYIWHICNKKVTFTLHTIKLVDVA